MSYKNRFDPVKPEVFFKKLGLREMKEQEAVKQRQAVMSKGNSSGWQSTGKQHLFPQLHLYSCQSKVTGEVVLVVLCQRGYGVPHQKQNRFH